MPPPQISNEELKRTLEVYEAHGNNQIKAARALNMSRSTLQGRLWKAESRGIKVERITTTLDTEIPTSPEALKIVLASKPMTLDEIAAYLKVSRGQALDMCEQIGVSVAGQTAKLEVSKTQIPSFVSGPVGRYESRADNTFVFGALGDTHLGSKYERLDVLQDLYARYEAAGVDRVFHTGNWVDGFRHGINDHDVHVTSMDGQLEYMAENYPKISVKTYAVAGDDHEGWWAQKEGINVGKRAEQTMREAGRNDWVDLGYMEAHVELVNKNTGKSTILAVVHPGGGSAYADSYSVQKIIESLDGGEKPAVALYGHYHKLMFGEYRNVWWVQTGCTQDQTPFARKKKLRFAVGGSLMRLEQDPETGAIIGCSVQLIRYFVKGYYNNRWNKAGAVQLPERAIV